MKVELLEFRLKDMERTDRQFRALHSALITQGKLLGLVIDLLKDRFMADGGDLKEIGKILLKSQASSQKVIRAMERETGPRDQLEALIEDFKALVETLPDD